MDDMEHILTLIGELDKRYEQRFIGQEQAVHAALTAAKEAVLKAEVAAEKRFEAVNEFRGQQSDLISEFLPRKEADQRFVNVEKAIVVLDNWRSKATGAALLGMSLSGVVGAAVVKAFLG